MCLHIFQCIDLTTQINTLAKICNPIKQQYIHHDDIDVLQAEGSSNKFIFYEVYEGADDIAHHKEQPHYAAWVAFKESGGTISSVSKKASGKFMT